MNTISIRLPDDLLREVDSQAADASQRPRSPGSGFRPFDRSDPRHREPAPGHGPPHPSRRRGDVADLPRHHGGVGDRTQSTGRFFDP